MAGPASSVIFSTPTTSTIRAALAAIARRPWWTAAEPVAQAFSTRVAGLKRKAGSAWSTSELVKSWATKPPLKWPSQISSISAGSRPASAMAAVAASTIRLSALRPSCLPNGRWLQPTMQAVMAGAPGEMMPST